MNDLIAFELPHDVLWYLIRARRKMKTNENNIAMYVQHKVYNPLYLFLCVWLFRMDINLVFVIYGFCRFLKNKIMKWQMLRHLGKCINKFHKTSFAQCLGVLCTRRMAKFGTFSISKRFKSYFTNRFMQNKRKQVVGSKNFL